MKRTLFTLMLLVALIMMGTARSNVQHSTFSGLLLSSGQYPKGWQPANTTKKSTKKTTKKITKKTTKKTTKKSTKNTTKKSSKSTTKKSTGATGKKNIIFKVGNLHYRIVGNNTCEVTNLVTSIRDKRVIIPSYVTHNKVKYYVIGIGKGALSREVKMTEVILPPKIQYVGPKAFLESNLETIFLPGNVKVKEWAFKDCKKLRQVIFGGKGWSFSANAFYGCTSLKTIHLNTTKSASSFRFDGANPRVICFKGDKG